jgi:hypothetical protein
MKFILIPSIFDKSKYRREPASLYGADDYIEAQDIPATLMEKINKLLDIPEEAAEKPREEQKTPVAKRETPEVNPEVKEPPAETKPPVKSSDALVEKARRLSRTIVSDIYLYNSAKMMESIKNGNFYSVFAAELREGQKLYENRIPQEIRASGNYYKETIEEFIAKKKKELS